jgi:hypothetical protein
MKPHSTLAQDERLKGVFGNENVEKSLFFVFTEFGDQ